MQEAEYKTELAAEGFVDVDNEPTRIFRGAMSASFYPLPGS